MPELTVHFNLTRICALGTDFVPSTEHRNRRTPKNKGYEFPSFLSIIFKLMVQVITCPNLNWMCPLLMMSKRIWIGANWVFLTNVQSKQATLSSFILVLFINRHGAPIYFASVLFFYYLDTKIGASLRFGIVSLWRDLVYSCFGSSGFNAIRWLPRQKLVD